MEGRKKILKVNILWLVIIFMSLFGSMLVTMFVKGTTASILAAQSLIVIPGIIYMIATKQNAKKLLKLNGFHIGSAFLVIILAFCSMPVVTLINAISMVFFKNPTAATITDVASMGLLYGLGLLALLPATVEEFTFRGILMGTYRDEGKRPFRAIIFSAIAFGLMHGNFNQMSYALVLGILLGIVVELTDSIFSAVLIHFCINGWSVTVSWALPKLVEIMKDISPEMSAELDTAMNTSATYTQAEMIQTVMVYIPIALVALVFVVLLLWAIASLNKTTDKIAFWFSKAKKEERAAVEKVRVFDVPYAIAAIFMFAMCIITEIALSGVLS